MYTQYHIVLCRDGVNFDLIDVPFHSFCTEKYEACSLSEAVTRIEMNWTTSEATLVYNNTPKWYSAFVKTTCCYSQITRTGSGKKADDQFK